MKQSGFRLVQRKFAQGVPIPISSTSAAPTPPEKKTEPLPPPRSVYHNNISARSLLDIVALQNLHRHKQQPLVLLKRLREDEIASAFSSLVKRPAKKRRGVKGGKNKMALRSRKRKSPDASKSATKRRKKKTSESTDDVPLAFYDVQKRRQAQANKAKLMKRNTRSRTEQQGPGESIPQPPAALGKRKLRPDYAGHQELSAGSNFTFKEPRNPVRMVFRGFPEQRPPSRAAATKGRQLRKLGRPSTRSSPRSSRSSSEEEGAAKRLRNTLVAERSQSPAPRVTIETPTQAANSQSPAPRVTIETPTQVIPSASPCLSQATEEFTFAMPSTPTGVAEDTTFMVKLETTSLDDVKLEWSRSGSSRSREDWCIENTVAESAPIDRSVTSSADNLSMIQIKNVTSVPLTSDTSQGDVPQSTNPQTDDVASTRSIESGETEQYADSELVTLNVLRRNMRSEKRNADKGTQKNTEDESSRDETTASGKRGNRKSVPKQKKTPKKSNRLATTKTTTAKAKRIVTRGAKARKLPDRLPRSTAEPSQGPSTANTDVYEFDAEREASRPPSGPPSGLRTRRSLPPSEAPQPPQPANKKKPQRRLNSNLPSTSGDTRDVEAIFENLSSSPKLLGKLLELVNSEKQRGTELGSYLAAEQAGSHRPGRNDASAYFDPKPGALMEALTFYPTAEEFSDPILYFEKIAKTASQFGLCKIVPPAGFEPPCNISDTIRFAVIYQYIAKMYNRWGPVTRELAAIKAHLRTQSVVFTRSPLLDGSELNLTKLYHVVERHGGLNNVMQRKRWGRVAEEMKLGKMQHPGRKLDPLYMRFLLPYATLSDSERQTIMTEVEKHWTLKYQKMLDRARNPFQRQARMLSADAEYESDEDEDDEKSTAGALREAEDCTVPGRTMNLATFKKVATALMDTHFESNKQPPSPVEVEKAYWKAVVLGTEHIVANTASIDTGEEGYGFPKDPEVPYGADPWNLKVLARNPNNVLRYLGQVLGVTVPTLHVNMVFSTSCWHRDPHGLPWVEYMHNGAEKIWYGIPKDESANFRRAVETLCPAYCQNKAIWLASEITMIPPNILSEHQVRLSRLIQRPGEYVMVFPEAHTCSITTGFGISESVYFASNTWLTDVYKLFQELRNSCEPTMFSLEQLLLSGSMDDGAPQQVCEVLCTLLNAELEHRRALEGKGLQVEERLQSDAPLNTSYFRSGHARDHDDECEYCRCTLFLSKVIGLTGRNSAVCPEHALRLLQTKKHKHVDVTTLEFLSSYSTRAVEDLVETLEARLDRSSSADAAPRANATPVTDLEAPTPPPSGGTVPQSITPRGASRHSY